MELKTKFAPFCGILFVMALSAKSPAPIVVPGTGPHIPERSQSQLNQEQLMNGARPEVGTVLTKETTNVIDTPANDTKAKSILAEAERNTRGDDAAQVLREANKTIESKNAGSHSQLFIGLFIASLGIGGLFAFKKWTDVAIPAPGPNKTKLRW